MKKLIYYPEKVEEYFSFLIDKFGFEIVKKEVLKVIT